MAPDMVESIYDRIIEDHESHVELRRQDGLEGSESFEKFLQVAIDDLAGAGGEEECL